MTQLMRSFYLFTGLHSFLIGLLPIFIPVILWNKGLAIAHIAFFIALSAVGFLVALFFWDKYRATGRWSKIVALSFMFEVLLASILLADLAPWLLLVAALINGAAGCFYWSTQRVLFERITQSKNTGSTFANFQILVVFALKLGVLLGSYLLAEAQHSIVMLLFFSISLLGYGMLKQAFSAQSALLTQAQPAAFSLAQIVSFKDIHHSKSIFLIDGVFLFLESYFWVLSLYLLTQQNLLKLGLIIVLLSVLLAAVFFVIKQRIDHSNVQNIFIISILGYALSWWLRAQLSIQEDSLWLYAEILLIAFLSSFFRLAFNKRFYDIAHSAQPIYYIICKSYYSQLALVLFFSVLGYFLLENTEALTDLQNVFLVMIPLVLVYCLYGGSKPHPEIG